MRSGPRARATIDDATIWYRIIAEGKRAG